MSRPTVERLQHEIIYLEQNKIPIRSTGELISSLDYEWFKDQQHPKLTDDLVEQLSEALLLNDKFAGPLNLEENALTDISALAISKVLRKRGKTNITKLNLSKNTKLSHKAGEYIGQALIDNPDCQIDRLNFEDVHLGDTGLLRIIEASN